jgi:hypothetical protein
MFFDYLQAVVMKHWLPLLIGFFGTIPWWIRGLLSKRLQAKVDRYLNPSAIKWLGVTALAISFMLANFLAWDDEHQKVKAVSTQLTTEKENNSPKFILNWNSYHQGDIPKINGCGIFLNMQLKNVGAPSVAYGWKLSVKSDVINAGPILPSLIPDGHKFWDEHRKLFARFSAANRLEEKATKPIVRGDMINGWLWFMLPGIHQKQLVGATITIYVRDIFDHEYPFSFIPSLSPKGGRSLYIPGSGPDPFLHNK